MSSKSKGAQPAGDEGLSPQQKAAAARKRNLEAKARGGGEGSSGENMQFEQDAWNALNRCTTQQRTRLIRYYSMGDSDMGQIVHRVNVLWDRFGEGQTGGAQQQTQQGRAISTGTGT